VTPSYLQSSENERARIRPRLVIGIWAIYALISLNQSYFWDEINGRPPDWRRILGFTSILCISWCAYTPIVIWAARRFPIGRITWTASLIPHIVLSTFFAMLDVLVDRTLGPYFGMQRAANYWSGFISQWDMNAFYYAVIVASVTAADFYAMYRDRQRKTVELHTELVTAKLEALKMQLQPHFLFNTLNAINALIHEDPEAADRMVTRLADLLRLTLYESRHEVPLARELEFVSAYVDIQQIRFQNRLTVSFEVLGSVLGARVPSLVLQPLVENAIRHGIAPRARRGTVWVRARRDANRLILEVEDDGVGMSVGERPSQGGIGLANTRARLHQLYEGDHELIIQSGADRGTHVRIMIPYVEAAEVVTGEVSEPAMVDQLVPSV
jgi:two-component system, LytTR family, sensor kinase